jgi:hypothetical protein
VKGETEAEVEAETGMPGTLKAIANVAQVLRMKITDDSHPRVRRLAMHQMRRGGSSRICIPTGGIKEKGIGHHMWGGHMEEGGKEEVGAVTTWRGA